MVDTYATTPYYIILEHLSQAFGNNPHTDAAADDITDEILGYVAGPLREMRLGKLIWDWFARADTAQLIAEAIEAEFAHAGL
jgi:hypothetical protein